MENQLITLPAEDIILKGLTELNDDDHIERLWRAVAKKANKQLYPVSIILRVELAISDYTQSMLTIMGNIINSMMSNILAVLVPDPEEYTVVISEWNNINSKYSKQTTR